MRSCSCPTGHGCLGSRRLSGVFMCLVEYGLFLDEQLLDSADVEQTHGFALPDGLRDCIRPPFEPRRPASPIRIGTRFHTASEMAGTPVSPARWESASSFNRAPARGDAPNTIRGRPPHLMRYVKAPIGSWPPESPHRKSLDLPGVRDLRYLGSLISYFGKVLTLCSGQRVLFMQSP